MQGGWNKHVGHFEGERKMKTKNAKETTGSGKAPVFVKRIGSVRASVWENEADGRIYHNITLVRRYKDGDEWRDITTLNGAADAVIAIEALRCCLYFIHGQEEAATESHDE